MNTEHDPLLAELFDAPPSQPSAEQFLAQTTRLVDRYQRRRRYAWLAAEVLILILAWIIAEPMNAIATQMMPWVMTSIVDTGDGMLSQLLAPINSVAGVIALLFLLGGAIYRRLLRR